MRRSPSTDPDGPRGPAFLGGRKQERLQTSRPRPSLLERIAGSRGIGSGIGQLVPGSRGPFEQQQAPSHRRPRTIFNVPIGGARRVTAQSWPIERFMAVKQAAGVTLNDVVLACGGALYARISRAESTSGPTADRYGPGEPA